MACRFATGTCVGRICGNDWSCGAHSDTESLRFEGTQSRGSKERISNRDIQKHQITAWKKSKTTAGCTTRPAAASFFNNPTTRLVGCGRGFLYGFSEYQGYLQAMPRQIWLPAGSARVN
jgi:hypothetical protein